MQDTTFNVCKGGIQLLLYSTETHAFLGFYADYLNLLLKTVTYDAEAFNVEIDIQESDKLVIDIFGFNDTVRKLYKKIAENLFKSHQTEKSKDLF